MTEQDDKIWVETMVASRTGEPAVVLRWYDHSGKLTPQEARAFALQLMEAAEALSPVFDSIPFTAPEAMYLRWDRAAAILNERITPAGHEPGTWRWTAQDIFVGRLDHRKYLQTEGVQ